MIQLPIVGEKREEPRRAEPKATRGQTAKLLQIDANLTGTMNPKAAKAMGARRLASG